MTHHINQRENSDPFPSENTSDQSHSEFDHSAFAAFTGDAPYKVFDSGCTRHMTPHRHLLTNYHEIEAQPIRAANSEYFSGIGVGTM
ncbi:hypothetical protein CPB83DRAFT_776125, partial [Crepidotus variabilis]